MSLIEARKHLDQALFAVQSPYPDKLDYDQQASLAYVATYHQQAALEEMWKSLQAAWTKINEHRAEHLTAEEADT